MWCGVTSQVTGRPAAFAARTCASEARVDTWVRWSRAPGTSSTTPSRIAIARATDDASAATGQPLRPRTVATYPSDASAPSVSVTSSGWSTIGRPSAPAYASALRRTAALLTGDPSSLNPTTPASASSPSAASVSPPRPAVTAPWTRTRTGDPDAAAAAWTRATTPGSSIAGVVLGIRQTVVNPPCAAAATPGRDRLRVLVAGLAEVRVEVHEAGRDEHAVCRQPVSVRARQPGEPLERAVRDDDLARRPRGPTPGPPPSRGP